MPKSGEAAVGALRSAVRGDCRRATAGAAAGSDLTPCWAWRGAIAGVMVGAWLAAVDITAPAEVGACEGC